MSKEEGVQAPAEAILQRHMERDRSFPSRPVSHPDLMQPIESTPMPSGPLQPVPVQPSKRMSRR
jgi:hypothetical protein